MVTESQELLNLGVISFSVRNNTFKFSGFRSNQITVDLVSEFLLERAEINSEEMDISVIVNLLAFLLIVAEFLAIPALVHDLLFLSDIIFVFILARLQNDEGITAL